VVQGDGNNYSGSKLGGQIAIKSRLTEYGISRNILSQSKSWHEGNGERGSFKSREIIRLTNIGYRWPVKLRRNALAP
jgi:hypothetical protein